MRCSLLQQPASSKQQEASSKKQAKNSSTQHTQHTAVLRVGQLGRWPCCAYCVMCVSSERCSPIHSARHGRGWTSGGRRLMDGPRCCWLLAAGAGRRPCLNHAAQHHPRWIVTVKTVGHGGRAWTARSLTL